MRLRRREILIVLFIWALVAVLFVVAVVTLRDIRIGPSLPNIPAGSLIPTPTLVPLYTPAAGGATTKELYPLALEAAIGWREDAQLVSCRGSWGNTAINLVGRPIDWNFRFYSPSSRLLYFVTAGPDGQVNGIQHLAQVYQPPPVVSIDDWQIDSPEALTNWLNVGGGEFLGSHPGIEVVAQLGVRSDGDPPQWTLTGYDRATGEYFAASVQAITGETIAIR